MYWERRTSRASRGNSVGRPKMPSAILLASLLPGFQIGKVLASLFSSQAREKTSCRCDANWGVTRSAQAAHSASSAAFNFRLLIHVNQYFLSKRIFPSVE
jgi:hypothetical protein